MVVLVPGTTAAHPAPTRHVISEGNYTLRADKEMHELVLRFPHLARISDWVPVYSIMGLAQYIDGPVYHAQLCANQLSDRPILTAMHGLASYLMKAHEGVVYEDQTNEFKLPDVDNLANLGDGFRNLIESEKFLSQLRNATR